MTDIDFFKRLPRALPGLALIVLTMVVIRNWVEPWMTDAVVLGQKGWLIKVTHLNYILLGIIAGLLYRNLLFRGRIPALLEDGFKLSRLLIKTGIILLGSLYTVQAIVQLGAMAVLLIGGFVILSLVLVLWLGRVFGLDRSMTAVLANALSICGVSAAVATAPAVEAKASHVAYAIATILGFGILTMFISPFIGHALGLTDLQYGAWVGTGILNSGQVLAAALAFNPQVTPGSAVSVAEIWNIMRVISIPFAVFAVTLWYWSGKTEESGERKGLGTLLVEKFPVFVIGFLVMVLLTSLGAFGDVGIKGGPAASDTIKMLRLWMTWIFGFGLVGLGAYIDFKELAQAGGAPLKVGLLVGVTKYVLALAVVLLIRDYLVAI
ncbi:putative sulfate exporter family transporter [uncultured Thiodictyon sp.]|uniref:YeiH family protein n=1 Tax=uncultured Thiodictyon sp. TaxID=1846217 RepID=UPI0025F60342|nr:putative sulfate exporter family transporter [uncultured Thiodictyon sp.]